MTKIPKSAITGIIICVVLIGTGCILAINSHNKEKSGNTVKTAFQIPTKFPYNIDSSTLYDVVIHDSIPQQIKDYTGFRVSFNKENRTPNYIAWELLGSEISTVASRSNNFWEDTEIENCPTHRDYTHSGYDRGHMCPAADQKWSVEAMNDCFVMANMCPQKHELNAGAWETLESKERQWAKRDSALMIIAGPIYEPSDSSRIGNIGVRVPSAFFKVFLSLYVSNPRAIAFVFPNMDAPGNMQNYVLTVDELEEILGYDFFSSLPDEIEDQLEAKSSFTEWNRK